MRLRSTNGEIFEVDEGELQQALATENITLFGMPVGVLLFFTYRYRRFGGRFPATNKEVRRIMPLERLRPRDVHLVKLMGPDGLPVVYEVGIEHTEEGLAEWTRRVGVRTHEEWREPETWHRVGPKIGELYEELDTSEGLEQVKEALRAGFSATPPTP